MLLKFMAALVAATTFVQALPAPDDHGNDGSALATTTINGFEVVIVYATPKTGCPATPTSCGALFPTSTSPAGLSDHAHDENTPSAKESPTASFTQEAPVTTLRPNLHWDCDTKPAKNVIPVPPEDGSKMYYGISDPSKAGEYAWLTYFFNRPSVNLDHTDHIVDIKYGPDGLEMHFDSDEAWDYAVDTWVEKDELVLITYTEGCGAYEKQDRCFFQVKSLTWKQKEHSIVAKGKPTHPDEIISRGESEWGYYTPRESAPIKTPSGGKRPNSGSKPTVGSGPGPSHPGPKACVPPIDRKYGLPTACLGHSFDRDLDALLGSQDLSEEYYEFLDSIPVHHDTQGNSTVHKRGFFDFVGDVVDVIVKPVEAVFDVVTDALAISGDIDKDFTFKLPDQGSSLGAGLVQTTSPWGDAIQLYKEELPSSDSLTGHISVYCVGCSVNGHAKLYGKAKWVPFKGIEEGFIEVNADLQLALKLGIDAAIEFKHNVHYDLFSMGLPGLSFGLISIGPRVEVGANVGLEASASGKLLAGAEMNLQHAVARLDFKDSDKTDVSGFDPNFVPVFEAEGRIKASASLGLPVGIHVGIKIAMFDLSAGIVDEPSIKATAEVAAKVSLGEDGLDGGIVETNGCTGISGQITWRNKLDLKASFFKDKNILDTNDKMLTQVCIPIGPQPGDQPPQPAEPPTLQPPVVEPPVAAPSTKSPAEPPVVQPPIAEPPVVEPPAAGPTSEPVESPAEPSVQPPASETPIAESPVESQVGDGLAVSPTTPDPIAETPILETPESELPTDGEKTQSGEEEGKADNGQPQPAPTSPSSSASAQKTPLVPPSSANTTVTSISGAPTPIKTPQPSRTSILATGTSSPNRPNQPFQDEDGLEFASLVSSSSSGKLAGCSNGNMYIVSKDGKNTPSCSDVWAFKEDALVADGTSRALHYYNNTMALLGVSRLRIEDESTIPETGVLVAWAPTSKGGDSMYLAVDTNDKVFYPVVCEYENGIGAKVFLAKDPSEGIKTLKGRDIQYSVTGGKVKECSPLQLIKSPSLTYGRYGVSAA